jgi:outer membrane lipoprotein-sorting protein
MISTIPRPHHRTPRAAAATLTFLLVTLSSCARSPAVTSPSPAAVSQTRRTDPTDGTDVVQAMHDRYATTWYKTLTFSQTTTITLPNGGTLVQQWLEAGKFPGRLRIDTDTAGRGGVIYTGDSVYQFANGKLAVTRADRNELLILGFDVYTQPVQRTVEILRKRDIDMSKVSRATWEGRPMFVVGAAAGDTVPKQFWIDAERLLFVRLMETVTTATGPRRVEYRFLRYVPHGNGWVAEEVVGLRDGKPSLHEVYANVRVDVPLEDATFDPAQWAAFTPWYRR